MNSRDIHHFTEADITIEEKSIGRKIAQNLGVIAAVVAALEIHFAIKRRRTAKKKLKEKV